MKFIKFRNPGGFIPGFLFSYFGRFNCFICFRCFRWLPDLNAGPVEFVNFANNWLFPQTASLSWVLYKFVEEIAELASFLKIFNLWKVVTTYEKPRRIMKRLGKLWIREKFGKIPRHACPSAFQFPDADVMNSPSTRVHKVRPNEQVCLWNSLNRSETSWTSLKFLGI